MVEQATAPTPTEPDTDDLAPEPWPDDCSAQVVDQSTGENVCTVVFGGGGFVRWTLAPVATLAGLSLLPGFEHGTASQIAWRAGVAAVFLLFATALWFPRRCGFAGRLVAGLVFVACCLYVADMARTEPAGPRGGPGEQGLVPAIKALAVFGLPCLWFALRGGRGRRGW